MWVKELGDIEIEKNESYHNKTPIFEKDLDIEKASGSNKKININSLLFICIMIAYWKNVILFGIKTMLM